MNREKAISMTKCVLVLAVIALCSGLLLGAFHIITYVDPLQSAYDRFAEDTGEAFSSMRDEDGKDYGNGRVVYYAVSDDRQTHAFLAEGDGGFKGSVRLYVYVKDGAIFKIVVGDHSETYMDRLEAADYYANFIGKDISSLDALAADAVSGATKSSTAVRNAVNAVVQYYKEGNGQEVQTEMLRGDFAAGGECNG